jgi:flagellar biosynthesis/type III secretory pathway M-ring protein FliF/YscJ
MFAQADLARERRMLMEQERQAREEERKRIEADLRRIEEEKRREYDNLMEYAKQYAGKDSRVVASVVKDWLGGDATAKSSSKA